MKKIIFPIALSVLLFSCGEDKKDANHTKDTTTKEEVATPKEPEVDLSELRDFDMSPYDLEATLFIPKKSYMISEDEEGVEDPIVEHNEGEAYWNLSMRSDKNWNITVEDWGDEEKSIALEKEIHKENADVYDYKYIEEGKDYLLYQRALKLGGTTIEMDEKAASKLPNYHFVVVKKINGNYITIKSNDMGEFRKISAKKMLNSARATK